MDNNVNDYSEGRGGWWKSAVGRESTTRDLPFAFCLGKLGVDASWRIRSHAPLLTLDEVGHGRSLLVSGGHPNTNHHSQRCGDGEDGR